MSRLKFTNLHFTAGVRRRIAARVIRCIHVSQPIFFLDVQDEKNELHIYRAYYMVFNCLYLLVRLGLAL